MKHFSLLILSLIAVLVAQDSKLEQGVRGLASSCLTGDAFIPEVEVLLPPDLLAFDKGQKQSTAQDFYDFLTKVELNSYLQQQRLRHSYGLTGPLFAPISLPTLAPLGLAPGLMQTNVWSGTQLMSALQGAPMTNFPATQMAGLELPANRIGFGQSF